MDRRVVLVGLGALAVAGSALAAEPAGSKAVEVGKIFPYLSNYLRLPAADRDRWTLVYDFKRDGRPAAGLVGWIDDGGRRAPLSFNAEGRATTLPTLAQLEAKRFASFDVPAGAKMGVSMGIEATLRPASELPAGELAAAVEQAGRGARKAAPAAVRMLVPKFDAAYFPGAKGGEVVFADGRTTPLPVEKSVAVFRPKSHPNARTVRFATPPRRVLLG